MDVVVLKAWVTETNTHVRTTTTKDMYPLDGSVTHLPTTQTKYQYIWWDSAQQARITYDAGSGYDYASTFGYDVNGRMSFVNIRDGRPRNVTFVTDTNGQVLSRREDYSNADIGDPWSRYYYFNGVRIGEITNEAAFEASTYVTAVNARTAPPSSSSPSTTGFVSADFDQAYEALTPNSIQASGQAWTVRDSDTLQGIAAAVWGDASLWYLIAEHNGLTSASILTAGQLLTVPAKVANFHNTSETFRSYDPNKALGDLNPTQPAPPKKGNKGCGVVGQIIAVAIAFVVGKFLGPVVGNAASQLFLMATGAQDKFDWKQLAIADLSAGVARGLEAIPQVATAVDTISRFNPHVASAAYTATANVITQGVSVATGLQDKFSWTQVAVSAVSGFTGSVLNKALKVPSLNPDTDNYKALKNWTSRDRGHAFLSSLGTSFSAAGTQSLIDGTSFGDNLIATLPQVIGATIGNAVVAGMQARAGSGSRSSVQLTSSRKTPVQTANSLPTGDAISIEILDPPGPGFGPITPLDAFVPRIVDENRRPIITVDAPLSDNVATASTSISQQDYIDQIKSQIGAPFSIRYLNLQQAGSSYVGTLPAQEVKRSDQGNVVHVEATSGIYISTESSNQFALIEIDAAGTSASAYRLLDMTDRTLSDPFTFSSYFGERNSVTQLGVTFELPPGALNGDPIGQLTSGAVTMVANTGEGLIHAVTHPGDTLWSAVKGVGYAIDVRNRPQDVRNLINRTRETMNTYNAAYQARGVEGVADVAAYRVGETLPALVFARGAGAGVNLTRTGVRGVVRPAMSSVENVAEKGVLPSGVGGTGAAYNKATGQGIYILRDELGNVRYIGRGDVPARIATHADSIDKGDLIAERLYTNNLTKAQAKGLEQRLIDEFGGASRHFRDSPLLNKINSYSSANPNAPLYRDAVTDTLWQDALRKVVR